MLALRETDPSTFDANSATHPDGVSVDEDAGAGDISGGDLEKDEGEEHEDVTKDVEGGSDAAEAALKKVEEEEKAEEASEHAVGSATDEGLEAAAEAMGAKRAESAVEHVEEAALEAAKAGAAAAGEEVVDSPDEEKAVEKMMETQEKADRAGAGSATDVAEEASKASANADGLGELSAELDAEVSNADAAKGA